MQPVDVRHRDPGRRRARRPRASTLGIPVKRLHTVVWVIASVLAYVAMFLRAGVVGLPIGQVLGPSFLLQALAAAVIGRMERLPTIAIAAIGIGMVDQAMTFQPGNRAAFNDAVLFLIVLFALLLTKRPSVTRGGRRLDLAGGTRGATGAARARADPGGPVHALGARRRRPRRTARAPRLARTSRSSTWRPSS